MSTVMRTSTLNPTRAFTKRQNKLPYHLPPTAVPINGHDVIHAVRALLDPEDSSKKFVSALTACTGNPNCFLVSSGRAALAIILLTLKRCSNRSQVILPAYTCPTVAQAILMAGLQPVFCDVATHTLDMDRQSLRDMLSQETLAIIPTHMYGLAQDISDLVEICRDMDIYIIEDAAQAFGALIRGSMVGNAGDFGFFSLGRGKCIPTGRGGVIVADKRIAPELINTIQETVSGRIKRDLASLVNFLAYGLATTPFGWWFIFRSPMNPAGDGMDIDSLPPIKLENLSPTQAGIGTSILKRIDCNNGIRRRNAQRLMALLVDFDFVHIPEILAESVPVFLRLPIIIDKKPRAELLYRLLSKAGIGVSRSYIRILPDLYPDHEDAGQKRFPGADHLADCLLTLPTHPYLNDDDIARIQEIFEGVDT